jgi:hypothetical protein
VAVLRRGDERRCFVRIADQEVESLLKG